MRSLSVVLKQPHPGVLRAGEGHSLGSLGVLLTQDLGFVGNHSRVSHPTSFLIPRLSAG